ncbi:MAG: RIP metalloprotease RseP [Clostridia bacterium]|nr:RIP metalloprotease RseP [Clostridia bacterium]
MTVIWGILKIIILLGTLVTIHELGHFLVAKACNVKVLKFAIGFGPKIFSKVKGETEYALRAIPFGGFVQMEGEDTQSEDERAFHRKPIWQRMLIIVAGATVNILFALVLYFGICASTNVYMSTIIENVDVTSAAYEAGLRSGDKIISVNGKNVVNKTDVTNAIGNSKTDDVVFEIERDGERKKIVITIPEEQIGMVGVGFSTDAEIVYIQAGGAAQNAGLLVGDKVVSVNGERGLSAAEYTDRIKASANTAMDFVIEREGEEKVFSVIPEARSVKIFDVDYKILRGLSFGENSYYAINETKYYFRETIKAFVSLLGGKAENAEVMGPVGIAGEITKTEDFVDFFYMMSAISFSLGIFNLLPIPGLDGGKFLFLLIEWIRKKPMKEKTEVSWQLAGFALIIMMAIMVTVKDVVNLF